MPTRNTVALVLAFMLGAAVATLGAARAEQPVIDRPIVERLVRAEETQARQLEALTRAADRCKR
jgi:hypothetical protein